MKIIINILILCVTLFSANGEAFAQQSNQTVINVENNTNIPNKASVLTGRSYKPVNSFIDSLELQEENELRNFLQSSSNSNLKKEEGSKKQKKLTDLSIQPKENGPEIKNQQAEKVNMHKDASSADDKELQSSLMPSSFSKAIMRNILPSLIGVLLLFLFYQYYCNKNLKREMEKTEERFEKEQLHILQEMAYYQMIADADNEMKIVYDENNVFVTGRYPEGIELVTQNKIQYFEEWLIEEDARKLRKAIEDLRQSGEPFFLYLTTQTKKEIEVEGRLTNMRCCIWVRNIPQIKMEAKKLKQQLQTQVNMLGILGEATNRRGLSIWIRNSKGVLVWVNEVYANAVGIRDVKDVISRQVEILAAKELSEMLSVLHKKEIHETVTHRNCVNGMRIYHTISIPYDKGGSYGIAHDITELTQARQSLEINEGAREIVFDNIQGSILVFNDKQRLSFANAKFVELTGMDKNWLDERPYANEIFDKMRENNLLPEQKDYRMWLAELLELNEQSSVLGQEWYVQNGQKLYVKKINTGNSGLIFIIDNLTHSLELSGKVDAMQILQAATLDNLQEAVAQFGADGRVKLCNKPFAKMFLEGIEYESEPHINDIASNPKRKIKDSNHFERLRQIVLNMEPQSEETDMIELKNGDIYKYTARFVEGGTKLVCYENQTHEIAFQKMLEEKNFALESTDRMKREFMAEVSQKLREPLNNVMAYSQMLDADMYGPLNQQQAELVQLMVHQCYDFKDLVDKIIDKAQIEAGNVKPKMKMAPLINLLNDTFRRVDGRLKQKNLCLNVKVPRSEISIIADPEHINKIVTHLLTESIEASKEGEKISFSCYNKEDGTYFTIYDNCPFEIEHDGKKKSHFELQPKNGKNRYENIGYQIASGLVKMHGGSISLMPTKDNKTTVEFVIPPPTPNRLH